jgi:hypothetical protein
VLDIVLTTIVVVAVGVSGVFIPPFGTGVIALFILPAAAVVINTIAVAVGGSTLGQRISGLVVVDARSGLRLTAGAVFARMLIIVSPFIACFVVVIAAYFSEFPVGPLSIAWIVPISWLAMLLIATLGGKGALHDWATNSTVTRRA